MDGSPGAAVGAAPAPIEIPISPAGGATPQGEFPAAVSQPQHVGGHAADPSQPGFGAPGAPIAQQHPQLPPGALPGHGLPPGQGFPAAAGQAPGMELVPTLAPSRPPPIAGVGFVQEEFLLHEMPLGLVIDWSMPLPVVSHVVPGSYAAQRPSLISGLVLVAMNKNGLQPGAKRVEVEARLRDERQRPLWLVFEAPSPERFDYFGAKKRARRKNQWKVKYSLHQPPQQVSDRGLSLTTQSFFAKHPERIPLSRWGDIDGPHFPLPPAATAASHSMRRVMSGPGPLSVLDTMHGTEVSDLRAKHKAVKLPPVLRGGFASTFSGDSADNFGERASTAMSGGYSNLGMTTSHSRPKSGVSWAEKNTPLRQAVSSKSLTWLAEGTPRPDEAYEHLVDQPQFCGPGPSERWPLNHEDTYICRLGDMALAWRVRDAYEVGFRGRKREKVTEMHITCEKGVGQLPKRVTRIDEVFCDMCGIDLAGPNSQQQANMINNLQEASGSTAPGGPPSNIAPPRATGAFYYCRRCKKNGNRYELCAACHAIEVLQGEGKHTGAELHPHFLRCEHASLVHRRFINDANLGMPHIRRIFCDHCGHLAGSYDTDHEVYVCPRCPEEHGLRFEICSTCAHHLATFGWGVRRLNRN